MLSSFLSSPSGGATGHANGGEASDPYREALARIAPLVVDCSTWDDSFDWSSLALTEEEDMSQSGEQSAIIRVLSSSLRLLVRDRQDQPAWQQVSIECDNFFAWNPEMASQQVSPDVFLLDQPPTGRLPRRYEVWKHKPPRFAIEVVSSDWRKDYRINPQRYAILGTTELILADPAVVAGETRISERAAFVRYQRDSHGRLVCTYAGPGPVHSTQLDAYLCFVRAEDGAIHVRVALDPDGRQILDTEAERANVEAERADVEAERANAEAERANAEAERANAEAERADAEARRADAEAERARAADARADELRAELARLQQTNHST